MLHLWQLIETFHCQYFGATFLKAQCYESIIYGSQRSLQDKSVKESFWGGGMCEILVILLVRDSL